MLKVFSMSVAEAEKLIHQFEACELPKEKWTHEAHFVMALWYFCHQPLPLAIRLIKDGIKKYNISVGGTNTDDSGYHETISVFYIRLIINYIMQTVPGQSFGNQLAGLWSQDFLQKDYPLRYYTRKLLMSKEARKNWIAPDIQSLE